MTENETTTVDTNVANNEPNVEEMKKKKPTRKERKRHKITNKLLGEKDIKYRGPLSYFHIRIIAWITFALYQVSVITSFLGRFPSLVLVPEVASNICSLLGALTTPLFVLAAFGRILSNKRSYKSVVLIYTAAFIGVFLACEFVYRRYAYVLLSLTSSSDPSVLIESLIGQRFKINIFSDILLVTLFHFFVNYTPVKHFQGKKLYIFRSFTILPVLYSIVCYVLKIVSSLGYLHLPIDICFIITTKSPIIHCIFFLMAIWIKNRKKLLYKVGGSDEEYKRYVSSNKESLAFSVKVAALFLIFAFIDLFALIVVIFLTSILKLPDSLVSTLEIGDSVGLILAIPLVLLYSYKRINKNASLDIALPIVGIGLSVFVYVEYIFNVLINVIKNAKN